MSNTAPFEHLEKAKKIAMQISAGMEADESDAPLVMVYCTAAIVEALRLLTVETREVAKSGHVVVQMDD